MPSTTVGCLYVHRVKTYTSFLLLRRLLSPLSLHFLLCVGRKLGLCITNIIPVKYPNSQWEEALDSLYCSHSLIKWWKRRLEKLILLLYVICVWQGRWSYRLQGCHKIPGPSLHLLLASTKTCMHQYRRKKMTLDKVSLCKWRWVFLVLFFWGFLVVFLHSVTQLTCLVHTKRQLCYFLGLLPSTLAAILCSVFIPLFWTDDVPPWPSSDMTSVTLFDGDLNHVVLCPIGVRRLHDSDQFHPLSRDWYKHGVHSLSWFLGFYCMLVHSPSWHLSFLPACRKSKWHNDKRHTWKNTEISYWSWGFQKYVCAAARRTHLFFPTFFGAESKHIVHEVQVPQF